jgi:chemotaxis protein methyltransferase CheR
MMLSKVREEQWTRLSELIAERTGLHFPRERRNDLRRSLAGAARELGIEDAAACIEWLLSGPPTKAQLQVLASHLTIGETYFFRDPQTMEAVAQHVLPELIRTRRGREQRLRIWSAACCTGEEPYSLAIVLHQLLPDLARWQVTITATDINARFLHKAAAGIYGEWSFRATPSKLKTRYFNQTAKGRYAIVPEIKRLVTFEHLNLVEDVFPSLATDTNAMDLIFCRNALMYFTPPQMRKVVDRLHHALVEGGWLVVSPSEASKAQFPEFLNVNFPGAILFQKGGGRPRSEPASAACVQVPPHVAPLLEESLPCAPTAALATDQEPASPGEEPIRANPLAAGQSLHQEGRYAEAAEMLLSGAAGRPAEPEAFSLLARTLANQGRLADALVWCERWIAADKMNAAGHYLRAVVLLEQGDFPQGRASLQRALYLDHNFVLAHFALGNLARSRGKTGEAHKHFADALHLLRHHRPDDLLPESDGLTAGRLTETIAFMTDSGNVP